MIERSTENREAGDPQLPIDEHRSGDMQKVLRCIRSDPDKPISFDGESPTWYGREWALLLHRSRRYQRCQMMRLCRPQWLTLEGRHQNLRPPIYMRERLCQSRPLLHFPALVNCFEQQAHWLPIAVALVRPCALPFAELPINVLLLSSVFEVPLFIPTNVLLPPLVLLTPAREPINMFALPAVLLKPERKPKKEFSPPVVFCPAASPAKRLRNPVLANTRLPAILY